MRLGIGWPRHPEINYEQLIEGRERQILRESFRSVQFMSEDKPWGNDLNKLKAEWMRNSS